MIIEVLSDSTEAHDRGLKFAQYRTLESLQEYVLVSQKEARIESYRRQEAAAWLLTEFVGLDARWRLDSLDCEIPLGEVYFRIAFEDPKKKQGSGD